MNLKTKVSSRRFLLLLAMLSATTFAIAQNFTGRIIDEQSQPMPFAIERGIYINVYRRTAGQQP